MHEPLCFLVFLDVTIVLVKWPIILSAPVSSVSPLLIRSPTLPLLIDFVVCTFYVVLYFMNYLSKLRVAGGKSYNNFYIDLAGGQNVASELGMFVEVGPEQILEWDPEVILLNGFEKKLSPKDVYDNPLFADLAAVKNRRVYKMPLGGYRWDPPNQESPLTWLWLSMVLHPERFDWDLPGRIDANYKTMYGQGVDAAGVKKILRFKMNETAANYDVFSPK